MTGGPLAVVRRRLQQLTTSQGRADARFGLSRKVLNPLFQPLGYVVVADHFYQPLLTDRADRELDRRARVVRSIEQHHDESVELLDRVLTAHAAEFFGPDGPPARFGYSRSISQLGPGDAEVLYAMIRHLRPRRVVEIGAGGSTLIIAAALAANDDGASMLSIDPFPAPAVRERLRDIERAITYELRGVPLQDAAEGLTELLEDGDVLFVDSSHVYRPGSDVEVELLDIYPRLRPGVVLHVHDIFLPDDYPPHWNRTLRRYWNEQYFLQAAMANSDRFRALLPLWHLSRTSRDVFARHLPTFVHPDDAPSSIWLRIEGDPLSA